MVHVVLRLLNRLGNALPRQVRRKIADFPGVLVLAERLSSRRSIEVTSPEGYRLVLNPLLHANLLQAGRLESYEPELRQAIATHTRPGMIAYDLGANVGVFSLLFARLVGPQGAVYAFEPEPNNYACLAATIQRNGLTHVHPSARAVGRVSGKGVFDRRGGAFSGRLVGESSAYGRTSNVTTVETTSIDDLVRAGLPAPDIVKIDVEGNEGLVLEGMAETLQRHRPTIVCELHLHLGDSAESVLKLLDAHGYAVRSLSSTPASAGSTAPDPFAPAQERQIIAEPRVY